MSSHILTTLKKQLSPLKQPAREQSLPPLTFFRHPEKIERVLKMALTKKQAKQIEQLVRLQERGEYTYEVVILKGGHGDYVVEVAENWNVHYGTFYTFDKMAAIQNVLKVSAYLRIREIKGEEYTDSIIIARFF